MRHRKIYVVGSLKNSEIPKIANCLRQAGHTVFDDWYSPGPDTDSYWQSYEKVRGKNYIAGLNGYAAKNNFAFDLRHLHQADTTVLVLPCGKSGHMELGYQLGRISAFMECGRDAGREGHILLQGEPEKWDLMYRFAHGVWNSLDELIAALAVGDRNIEV